MLIRARGATSSPVNPHNLKGFLDAFKAGEAPGGRFGGIIPASLTHREEFA
jgi:hypothetical protein